MSPDGGENDKNREQLSCGHTRDGRRGEGERTEKYVTVPHFVWAGQTPSAALKYLTMFSSETNHRRKELFPLHTHTVPLTLCHRGAG